MEKKDENMKWIIFDQNMEIAEKKYLCYTYSGQYMLLNYEADIKRFKQAGTKRNLVYAYMELPAPPDGIGEAEMAIRIANEKAFACENEIKRLQKEVRELQEENRAVKRSYDIINEWRKKYIGKIAGNSEE